ncbi:MAG TPA: vitamin K epoxide reductase family protein, partial [Solirubrobacteraceae bacterium]|nr:vitamin K epoxide reductase family protein [Solirubrobacteraceae bacterium]
VSDDLRRRVGPHLRARRRQTALMVGAVGSMGLVLLYQTGILRHLPDPPLPGMDSDKVDASGEAYDSLKTPDAAVAIASYGATLGLIGMGAADRADQQPLIPLLAAAKIAADAAGAAWLTAEQITKHRALCFYCLAASAATWAALPAALPEARDAWRRLRR